MLRVSEGKTTVEKKVETLKTLGKRMNQKKRIGIPRPFSGPGNCHRQELSHRQDDGERQRGDAGRGSEDALETNGLRDVVDEPWETGDIIVG